MSTATKSILAPEDLAEVIQAYSAVADRLQSSHEALQNEVVRLREELANKNAQLERSKRLSALGEMAAGIAHEIRNPLAAIQLYAEMVVEDLETACTGAIPADVNIHTPLQNTQKINSAVRGLSAIVVDVLSFARQIEPSVMQLDANETLQRVVDAHRPAIKAAGVEVVVDATSQTLHADADLIHQALLNLARNAVDAMADREHPRRLTLTAQGQRITIADTGPGIDPAAVDRLFNPFFTTRNTGTGLGLAIVHRIVDAHDGTISVRNDPDSGAVFEINLRSPMCDLRSESNSLHRTSSIADRT